MKATELLKQQHNQVKKLFQQLEKTESGEERSELLQEISHSLEGHMMIEEEIFYPAVREAGSTKKMQELVPEAYEEHHVVKLVMHDLPQVDPEDERFKAKMTVLKELIEHHVEEEEKEMFKSAEKQLGAQRLEELGTEMEQRMAEAEGEDADDLESDEGDDDEFEDDLDEDEDLDAEDDLDDEEFEEDDDLDEDEDDDRTPERTAPHATGRRR